MTISSLVAAVVVLVLGATTVAVAHPPKPGEPPHSHGPRTWPPSHAFSREEIVDRAKIERDRLIREQKVEPAWQGAGEPVAEEIVFDGRPEWVVTFRHPAPADKAKERLYIFFTPTGRFVAANHTGR
jgi:hypothetical protein